MEKLIPRDPIGIRPLYYGYDEDGVIVFASEAKNLTSLVEMCIRDRESSDFIFL